MADAGIVGRASTRSYGGGEGFSQLAHFPTEGAENSIYGSQAQELPSRNGLFGWQEPNQFRDGNRDDLNSTAVSSGALNDGLLGMQNLHYDPMAALANDNKQQDFNFNIGGDQQGWVNPLPPLSNAGQSAAPDFTPLDNFNTNEGFMGEGGGSSRQYGSLQGGMTQGYAGGFTSPVNGFIATAGPIPSTYNQDFPMEGSFQQSSDPVSAQQATVRGFPCSHLVCTRNFKRSYERTRHETTVHGC